jgi:uncharacterized protein YndB with AHSA1/START domain
MSTKKISITVKATVNAPIEKVWKYWVSPLHITKWYNASNDWHTPKAKNDINQGGKFDFRMEAKDGSFGFNFSGIYTDVKINEHIDYTMDDSRKATITFTKIGNATMVTETFEAETTNSIELQQTGWQSILNNFKKYTESN